MRLAILLAAFLLPGCNSKNSDQLVWIQKKGNIAPIMYGVMLTLKGTGEAICAPSPDDPNGTTVIVGTMRPGDFDFIKNYAYQPGTYNGPFIPYCPDCGQNTLQLTESGQVVWTLDVDPDGGVNLPALLAQADQYAQWPPPLTGKGCMSVFYTSENSSNSLEHSY